MKGTFTKHGYIVEVSEREVYVFARQWPGSSLLDHEGSISFSFEPNGDLVDMDPSDIDGSDVAALSEDAQRWAEKQPGFRTSGLESRFNGVEKPKIAKKLATSGSLEELKKLIAEFYYSKPERITFTDRGTHWQVQSGEKVMSPIIVQQGKRFVFGTGGL